MDLAQAMALIVPPVNDLKRRALTRADGETTMFSTLVVVRDGRVLAAVSTPRMAETLACAHTAAVGLAPQLLAVAAQVTLPDGSEGIAYTTMSAEHRAGLAVQQYSLDGDDITFGVPERGEVEDRSIMDELARALNHPPLDAARVATQDASGDATAGPSATIAPGDPGDDDGTANPAEPELIPTERGRMAIDSGTCASLHRTVAGIGGTVVYVAQSPEHATGLLAHGMPQQVLVG